tara:strand:- start:194 stop:1159 length:966 start_codon:yes stop_codon:yes gene_type:complete
MKKTKHTNYFNYNFINKVVLITGASQGLGFEVAKSYLTNGANLVICSSNFKKIKEAYSKLKELKKKNQRLYYLKIDVSSSKDVKKLISYSIKKLKKIDILVNNAGIYGPKGLIEEINWKDWIKTIEVNLFGSILLCKEIIPHFKKKNKGKIIQLSGGGAASPLPRISGYAVSKVGVVRFIENLSEEIKDYNIDINSVAPGAINTGMLEEVLSEGPKKIGIYYYQKALKQKKLGGSSFKSACDLILFLGSRFSDGIKGKLISALWDDWKNWPKYKKVLQKSDAYTLRRITGKDRNLNFGRSKIKSIYDISLAPYKNNLKTKK